jgi:hypothetical protein
LKERIFFFALAAMAAVALVPAAPGTVRTQGGAEPRTTAPDLFVDIRVTITDTRISLDRHIAPRAAEARFVIRNTGTKTHVFAIGTAKAGSGVQTGFSRTVKPSRQKIVLFFLSYRGRLPYRSTTPADLAKPGMRGIFTVA